MHTPQKTKLSWEDIDRLVRELADAVQESGYAPDYLIGIAAGGLVPLALLSQELRVADTAVVVARSYEGQKRGELVIEHMPELRLQGKKVLLIDEIADSGQTLRRIAELVRRVGEPAELKSATMVVHTKHCEFPPDFSVLKTDSWVAFPWERSHEAV